MIEKIGNIFYPAWRAGFDGNVMGVGGVSQIVTTRNGRGYILTEYAKEERKAGTNVR